MPPPRKTKAVEERLRRRCQTDLMFLGREVLGYDLEEVPHREMCEFFVQKDPELSLAQQSEVKERQLLVQRGAFKSTMNVIDCVQWTICFPDVRILYLTDEKSLGQAFADEYRNHFVIREGEALTSFQELFPEFCVPASAAGPAGEFLTPARTRYRKEPTLWANSVLSRLPGWHCDVGKLDDVVNDVNSEDPDQRLKVIKRINFARKLLDPGGYWDVIGTPYDPADYYVYQRQHADEKTFVFLCRPAWEVKEEAKRKELKELTEEDIEAYYFPSRWGWKELKRELNADPVTFASQFLCDVKVSGKYIFNQALIDEAMVDWKTLPAGMPFYSVWDFSYSKYGNKERNLSANVVMTRGRSGELVVVECKGDVWGPQNLAEEVVDPMTRYNLSGTYIEDTNGARWLEPAINTEAERNNVQAHVLYVPVDCSPNAKRLRIYMLADLMREGSVKISSGCIGLEFLTEQLLAYSGKPSCADDVPDVIGIAAQCLGNYRPKDEAKEEEERDRLFQEHKKKVLRDLVYPSAAPEVREPEPRDAGILSYWN